MKSPFNDDTDFFWKTIGKFDIFTDYEPDDQDPDEEITFLLKLSYQGIDPAWRREALGVLAEAQFLTDLEQISTLSVGILERENHPILGTKFSEYGVELYSTAAKVEKFASEASQHLTFPTHTGEIIPDFSKMKISLSCAYKEGSTKHVKVRFGGFSVKYYFNSSKWMKTKTQKELEDYYTPGKVKMIMSVLENPEIFNRANTKPANQSGIGESTPISLHVLLPDKKGWKLANNSKEVNNPETEPALLLRDEGYGTSFLVNESRIYKITSFRRKAESWEGDATWIDDKYFSADKSLRILPKALEEIEVDEFTKKRIERAIKRKL